MINSNIEWTDHTFNPWIGCTKVSPGCAHCYAETLMDKRYGRVQWGEGNPRQRTSAANWKQPLRWNKQIFRCELGDCPSFEIWSSIEFCSDCSNFRTRHRPRVFCASLADWLDDEVPIEWLADLLMLIHDTPNLDWLLLTKRPENSVFRMREAWGHLYKEGFLDAALMVDRWFGLVGYDISPPSNIWVGVSVEDQKRADERIPELLTIPGRVRFLSVEPMLGPIILFDIDWVICGGESGSGKRPFNPDWARDLRDQCAAAGVPFFMKQMDKIQPIPPDLMIRQFPSEVHA